MKTYITVRELLLDLIVNEGYTRNKIAGVVGIHPFQLTKYIKNKAAPSYITKKKFEKHFNCEIKEYYNPSLEL